MAKQIVVETMTLFLRPKAWARVVSIPLALEISLVLADQYK